MVSEKNDSLYKQTLSTHNYTNHQPQQHTTTTTTTTTYQCFKKKKNFKHCQCD